MKPTPRIVAIVLNVLLLANLIKVIVDPPEYSVAVSMIFLVFAAPVSALAFIYGK